MDVINSLSSARPNNQFRVVNTYPEYWVDGKPFLMHGAAFFYHRIHVTDGGSAAALEGAGHQYH